MNARPSILETLVYDDLGRVARYIESDTHFRLLGSKKYLFALISQLLYGAGSGVRFRFESSAINISNKEEDFVVLKSLSQDFQGLQSTNVTLNFFTHKEAIERFLKKLSDLRN